VCNDLLVSDDRAERGRFALAFRLWMLPVLVALPAIGLTVGIVRAAIQVPSERASAALMASRDVPPALAAKIVRSAFAPTLLYLFSGTAAALTLLLLLAVAGAEKSRRSRRADDLSDFPGIVRRLLPAALLIALLIAFSAWSVRTAQTLGSVALFALFIAA